MGISAILASIFGERGISGTVVDVIKEFHLSPEQEAQIQAAIAARELELMKLAAQRDTEQAETNKVEAANASIFVAGWRPWIGWVCGASFAYTFVIQPFLVFLVVVFGAQVPLDLLPKLDWSMLSSVLLGMLGLGYMRTQEKIAAGQAANGH